MICYDRPYISDHILYDSTTACTVTSRIRSSAICATSISGTGIRFAEGTSTHPRELKKIPKRYKIGPVETQQVEHVKLDIGRAFAEYAAPRSGMMERGSRGKDRDRAYASADEVEVLDTDGRRSPIRRKLDKPDKSDDKDKDKDKSSSVISRMLSRTRLRPSVQPPPLINPTYPAHPGSEPKHIHHLQNGKLPSFDESFDVSAYYTGSGRGEAGAGASVSDISFMIGHYGEFDTPKRSRASEDGPYLNHFSHTARQGQAGPSSPSRKGNSGAGSTPHHPQKQHRISPSRAHFGTNPKLFPTSSPRAYQYEPLPPLPLSAGLNTSISSTRGIKEPPNEPYPYLAGASGGAHRRHHSHDARAGSGSGSGTPEDGDENEGDVTLNGNTERPRPASIAASTIPLPPSPPHTAIMPSSFVLPAELRRAKSDLTDGNKDGDLVRMGSVKRERVPTPIPGEVGVTSVRISPMKSKAATGGAADEHGIKVTVQGSSPQEVKAQRHDGTDDVFSDFDRFFAGFPPPRRAGTALGTTEITTSGGGSGGGDGVAGLGDRLHPSQKPTHAATQRSYAQLNPSNPHREPTYRTGDHPISVALTRERSLPTPPLTNGSSSGSHTDSAYSSAPGVPGVAGINGEGRIEHAIHNLQLVIQTLQATGADQAAALLRQAELEMRLQSMDEELGQVREQNVRLEVQVRREREERRKVIKEAEERDGGWREKVKSAEEATSTAQSSLHHLHLAQTASSTRITSLEADLRTSAERNASLKTHINELESEIVRLGGAFDLVKADYARREEALKKRLAEAEFMHHALKESGARIGRELEVCKKRGEELEKRSRGYI